MNQPLQSAPENAPVNGEWRAAFERLCKEAGPLLIKGHALDDAVFAYLLDTWACMDDMDERELMLAMQTIKSVAKKMTPEYLVYCRRHLDTVCEKKLKHRYYDAIVLLGKAALSQMSTEQGLELLDEVESRFEDEHNRGLVDLMRAFFHHAEGRYAEYERTIRRVKDMRVPGQYIFTPLGTSLDRDLEELEAAGVRQTLFAERKYGVPADTRYVVCASCDEVYFEKYSRYFVESFAAAARGREGVCAHVTLLVSGGSCVPDEGKREEMARHGVYVSLVDVGEIACVGPLASAFRLIDAYHLRRSLGCEIATVDMDCFFRKIPSFGDEEFDLCVRKIENVMPWESYAAGFTFYPNNELTSRMLDYVFVHLNHYYDASQEQWWIDQNAIEAAIRTLVKQGADLRLGDVRKRIEDDLLLPTGSEPVKMRILDNAYSELGKAA